MRVDRLDPPDVADIHAIAGLISGYWREVIPGEPDYPAALVEAQLTKFPAHRRVQPFVARDGDAVVGMATVVLHDQAGLNAAGWMPYLIVEPASRRRGVGTALLDAASDFARSADRVRIEHMAPTGLVAGVGFAESRGAVRGMLTTLNRLAVDAADIEQMHRWLDPGPAYELVAFDGPCPETLLAEFAALQDVMNDAPRAHAAEQVHVTADQLRAAHRSQAEQGLEMWTICARHTATTELVGYTEIRFSPHRPWLAVQEDTGVHPAHRHRGVARALKAAAVLRVGREQPAVVAIQTYNASTNAPILAINRAMGFRAVAELQDWELSL